jgi:hypothetical protein
LGAEKCARGVDVHDALPFFGFDVEDVLTTYDTGEGAENVDLLQQRCSFLYGALDAGWIRDIHAHFDDVGLKVFVEGVTRFDVVFAFEL